MTETVSKLHWSHHAGAHKNARSLQQVNDFTATIVIIALRTIKTP